MTSVETDSCPVADRRTLVITGVSIGSIGFETCKTIIQTQKYKSSIVWDLILAQREPSSSDSTEALQRLRTIATGTQCRIIVIKCDLADATTIKSFATRTRAEFEHVDVLILNAATIVNSFTRTIDNNEHMFQVNHLGQFLLVSLLQDRLKERVIFVNSSLHKKADALATLESLTVTNEYAFNGMNRYAQSKLLTAYCLARWHKTFEKSGVKVILASPGNL